MLTGLVVGKFCPLHKGHEALFAFARARCDRLVILSYTKPEFPRCSPERRAEWLAALCPDDIWLVLDDATLADFAIRTGSKQRVLPHNDAPEIDHRAFCAWVCEAMLGLKPGRVFTSETYGDGFAALLSEQFGRPVEHLLFDSARAKIPISATRLRDGTGSRRDYLSPIVRRSFVHRVALIGGESTGKTTLAADLAAALGTIWVPEYGRELWEERSGDLRYEDMLAIAREQIRREDDADAGDWLVCDTTPAVTAFYSEAMFGRVDPDLAVLAGRAYDHIFLCEADFPFVQDGTRRDDAFRERQNAWYRVHLARGHTSHTNLLGSTSHRLATAMCILETLNSI